VTDLLSTVFAIIAIHQKKNTPQWKEETPRR